MTDVPTPAQSPAPRPRPIMLAQSVLAALTLVVGTAGFADHVPAAAAWWIVTGLAAVQVGLAVYLERVSTPLSSPQDARGVPLVPVDVVDGATVHPSGAVVVSAPAAPTADPGFVQQ